MALVLGSADRHKVGGFRSGFGRCGGGRAGGKEGFGASGSGKEDAVGMLWGSETTNNQVLHSPPSAIQPSNQSTEQAKARHIRHLLRCPAQPRLPQPLSSIDRPAVQLYLRPYWRAMWTCVDMKVYLGRPNRRRSDPPGSGPACLPLLKYTPT